MHPSLLEGSFVSCSIETYRAKGLFEAQWYRTCFWK
jgi:hypothetical protein